MRALQTDVVVIGAGAAGLAAARRLHERDVNFLVLEARDRTGGRAYTLHAHDGAPVELGAEFIHGKPEVTFALLREIGARTTQEHGQMLQLRNGRIESAEDIWETSERLLRGIDLHGPDQSFEAFVRSLRTQGVPEGQLDALYTLIEGFDAANASDASAIGIAREWLSGVNDEMFRLPAGYGPVMQHLTMLLGERIMMQTRVEAIQWSAQSVSIRATQTGEPLEIVANRAIVTLPVGVLRKRYVSFIPELPARKQKAIEVIAMGPVIRVVHEFRSPFWEHVDGGQYRDAGFLQTYDNSFSTIWTRYPQRTTLLVAWAGGGAAQRLIDRKIDPVAQALQTVKKLFPSVDVQGELLQSHFHDWQTDPFACGAYSYLRVGAGNARARLGAAEDKTLFFAGEATSVHDSGTVAGAIESGYRAADEASLDSGA